MGTTAVAVMFQSLGLLTLETRLYRLRSDKLEQMTEDHTLVAVAFKFGDITPEAGLIPTDIFYRAAWAYRSALRCSSSGCTSGRSLAVVQ